MAIKLNKAGFDHARELIQEGLEVDMDPGNWEEVKPTVDDQARYLNSHSLEEYGLWFLGINDAAPANDKSKYVYPHGDLNVVQESALHLAVKEAAQKKDEAIHKAAQELLNLLDEEG